MRRVILFLVIFLTSCGGVGRGDKPQVTVSIAPLGYLVERLADTLVDVRVLVPETTSPETYDPTARQIAGLSESDVYFSVGLIDFERALGGKISSVAPQTSYVDLSEGLDIMAGSCSHGSGSHVGHSHGVDPHIWLSPIYMQRMAVAVADNLTETYPEYAEIINGNLAKLNSEFAVLDSVIRTELQTNNVSQFAIVHPSLSYFARDYGLTQHAIETDGKEPSAGQISRLVNTLREAGVKKIFYSRQNPDAAARTVAQEIGAELVEYDPLSGDWAENMNYIVGKLCN